MNKPFLVVGVARSGTTSLINVLGLAINSHTVSEPIPNLNIETRLMMENKLNNPTETIKDTIIKRFEEFYKDESNAKVIYGEKNVTYAPFVSEINNLYNCKFVYIYKDGRDVVTSLINWHNQKFGTVYRECKDIEEVSSTAFFNAANLPLNYDTSDYSRPRPLISQDNEIFMRWDDCTRFEMCSFYWNKVNSIYLDSFENLPRNNLFRISYDNPNTEDILKLADFLNIKFENNSIIKKALDSKLNSLESRNVYVDKNSLFPHWTNWNSNDREIFCKVATKTMERLGYFKEKPTYWKPKNYGSVWIKEVKDPSWYQWMFDTRINLHKDMIEWVKSKESSADEIKTIYDYGCGIGVGYSQIFKDLEYNGVDISLSNIDWCKKNRKNNFHNYFCKDFIKSPMKKKADLVFSSGTIDNSYDMDAFILSMINSSKKWIYLTAYRGWFPDLKEHRYSFSEKDNCFYNDISPNRVGQKLKEFGCKDIQISPLRTGLKDVIYETRIIARV
tara:strand:- start:929 stop:2434 length:1506 start_codon:yes stop_codon:yes gene_type:complete